MSSTGPAIVVSAIVAAGVSAAMSYFDVIPSRTSQDVKAGPEKPALDLVEVPNFAGMALESARAQAEKAGVSLGTVQEVPSNAVPEGQIIATIPPRYVMVKRDTVIEATVSAGEKGVAVPDLVKMNVNKAKEALTKAGLKVELKRGYSDRVPFRSVIKQDPAAGETLEPGASVTLTINNE